MRGEGFSAPFRHWKITDVLHSSDTHSAPCALTLAKSVCAPATCPWLTTELNRIKPVQTTSDQFKLIPAGYNRFNTVPTSSQIPPSLGHSSSILSGGFHENPGLVIDFFEVQQLLQRCRICGEYQQELVLGLTFQHFQDDQSSQVCEWKSEEIGLGGVLL
ncbi:hypothetical protein DUI87_11187 [Hirundo rustica rustica]|uniref:Uncharacterized protein n=1 Tax=Hirundo rustica rustica TaxID=333673 RepID=A0A3M0KLF8_HIRRU|nr:hypothetical protein DUI87_11187 [Hirundo rustica rustica]